MPAKIVYMVGTQIQRNGAVYEPGDEFDTGDMGKEELDRLIAQGTVIEVPTPKPREKPAEKAEPKAESKATGGK